MKGVANITIKSAPTNSIYDGAVGGQDGSICLFKADRTKFGVTDPILKKRGNPVVRLSWSKHNPNLLAALHLHARKPTVIDVRNPSIPLAWKDDYGSHDGFMSDIAWSNGKRNTLWRLGQRRTCMLNIGLERYSSGNAIRKVTLTLMCH